MPKFDRFEKITQLVNQRDFITIKDLADNIGISQATIRRDVEQLTSDGLVKKVQGGVVPVHSRIPREPSLRLRSNMNVDEKLRIANAALAHIHDGDHVIFDAGTTVLTLAKALDRKEDLTVITYDLFVALELANNPGVELIMAGGALRRNFYSFYGYFTENVFREIHADKAFISCDALDPDLGIMSYTVDDINVKKSIIDAAEEVILLCDHSKLNIKTFINIAKLDCISKLIVGREVDGEVLRRLSERFPDIEIQVV